MNPLWEMTLKYAFIEAMSKILMEIQRYLQEERGITLTIEEIQTIYRKFYKPYANRELLKIAIIEAILKEKGA